MVKITFDAPMPAAVEEVGSENAVPAPEPDMLSLRLADAAATRIAAICSRDGRPGVYLRVQVVGGGCSGFSYTFKLETPDEAAMANRNVTEDIVITNAAVPDAAVRIDPASLALLKGGTLDFEETLEASQFIIRNPNAKTSCGCGSSFSI